VREIRGIPEASSLTQGRCNRYRSFLTGHGTADPGIRVVGEPRPLFGSFGSEWFEDIRLNRLSLRGQRQMQVALP
jgi:hypothetical protein